MSNAALPNPEPHHEMTLMDHLRELRTRLLYSMLAVLVGTVVAFCYINQIYHLLSTPFQSTFTGGSLIGTGPAEAFVLKIRLSIAAGILLVLPVLFYQLWAFIAPGLYESERRYVIPFVVASTACFPVGAWFCFAVVLPFAFEIFAAEYASLGLTPAIRVSEQLSMVSMALLGFGAVFEMPMLAFFLARVGVITDRTLIDGARYAVVIIFVVSAVLTPPDVLTQFLMAGPLLLLYGLSIVIVKFVQKREADPQDNNPGS